MAPITPNLWELGTPTLIQHGDWSKHFAWRQVVTISGRKIWLKTCYKRRVVRVVTIGPVMAHQQVTEYGDAFDMLKQ